MYLEDEVQLIPNVSGQTKQELDSRNYLLKNTMLGWRFEKIDPFTIPKNVYGNPEDLADRYLKRFNSVDKNLGIALTGLKGTGKSMLAKMICVKSNLPVIIITDEYAGTGFNSLMESIKQPCIIFIDEFEKIYSKEAQDQFLSLLDGVSTTKKLFLFTSNDMNKYNSALINRPGRVHYLKHYDALDYEIIEAIAKTLDNKKYIPDFIRVTNQISDISVDICLSLVNESNLFKESPLDAVKYMNITPSSDEYNREISFNGKKIEPFTTARYNHPLMVETDDWDDWDDEEVSPDDIFLTFYVPNSIILQDEKTYKDFLPLIHNQYWMDKYADTVTYKDKCIENKRIGRAMELAEYGIYNEDQIRKAIGSSDPNDWVLRDEFKGTEKVRIRLPKEKVNATYTKNGVVLTIPIGEDNTFTFNYRPAKSYSYVF